jgi:electron transport complex protein RnfD
MNNSGNAQNDSRIMEEINSGQKLLVTSSPHFRCGTTTKEIMQDVCIASIPAVIASVVLFGFRAALLTAVCVASCVGFEWLCRKVMKRKQTIGDFSAVVTGILLALSLPPELNPIYAVFGSAVAIVVVKQMFGGIGMNFANPALTARIVMMISFPSMTTAWARPFAYLDKSSTIDAVSSATPLSFEFEELGSHFSLFDFFAGNHAGSIGETCAVALLLGGGYLLLRGVIKPIIPICFVGTAAVIAFIAGLQYGLDGAWSYTIYHVFSGGLIIGAFFMATDYTTSPVTDRGKVVFAIGCGVITMIIRLYAGMPEGVSFSILIMNILVPHIEQLTSPVPFGYSKPKRGRKGESETNA